MALATAPECVAGYDTDPPADAHSPGVSKLAHAVASLAAEEVEDLTDVALGEDLIALRLQIDRLEAQFCRRLRPFESRKGHFADGAASLVSWLRSRCRLSGAGAYQRAEVARRLEAIPGADEGFQRGDFGYRHAVVLARTVSEVGPEAAASVGPELIESALQLDPDRLRVVSRHLRHIVDPEGALEAALLDQERRHLHISQTFDGVFVLDGLLDSEGGALIRTAIAALSAPRRGDERTAAQRRADALVELARRQLNSGTLPSAAGERPHLLLIASTETLAGQHGCAPGDLVGIGPVAAATVRRLACDAAVTSITVDEAGQPLNVGRSRRTIPPSIRRALAVRDKGCVFPVCDRPFEWTVGHHLKFWADNGETSLDNLGSLCTFHHRLVHEEGWTLQRGSDGAFTARPP